MAFDLIKLMKKHTVPIVALVSVLAYNYSLISKSRTVGNNDSGQFSRVVKSDIKTECLQIRLGTFLPTSNRRRYNDILPSSNMWLENDFGLDGSVLRIWSNDDYTNTAPKGEVCVILLTNSKYVTNVEIMVSAQ